MTIVDERPEAPLPNPGSYEAVTRGCLCPATANNLGRVEPRLGGWFIEPGCPLHAPGQGA
jgi:hypothetical protein